MLRPPQVVGCALLLLLLIAHKSDAQEIRWSGYEWIVRSNAGAPGPNEWSKDNVTVDSAGMLHLKISRVGKQWYCAEVFSKRALAYGTYQFSVIGRIDQLDRNVVLGLFNYPEPDSGPDGTSEIDIEFSHWGNAALPIGNFTAWPREKHEHNVTHPFKFDLQSPDTTQRFIWRPHEVEFQSLRGHTDGNERAIDHWTTPTTFSKLVASKPMPVHMNLWLFEGKPPSDDKPIDVVVKAFKYTPQ